MKTKTSSPCFRSPPKSDRIAEVCFKNRTTQPQVEPINMTEEQLLVEIEDIIKKTPTLDFLRHQSDEALAWMGRTMAVINEWDSTEEIRLSISMNLLHNSHPGLVTKGRSGILVLLNQALYELKMKTTGPTSVLVSSGMPYEYFEEIKGIIKLANNDILFVDPYLDDEFVSRYLPFVKPDVVIRLLAGKRLSALVPAVTLFMTQNQQTIEVRSCSKFHDRFIFIDGISCYLSGASFKDGASASPATITQITDAFQRMHDEYDEIWQKAKVEI